MEQLGGNRLCEKRKYFLKKVIKSELREDTACMKQGQDTARIKNRKPKKKRIGKNKKKKAQQK